MRHWITSFSDGCSRNIGADRSLDKMPAGMKVSCANGTDFDQMRDRGRRPGRHDVGLSSGPRRRGCDGAGKAQGFPARFPRRHGASLYPADHARAGAARKISQAAAQQDQDRQSGDRRPAFHRRRFRPPADRLQIHRPDAAMGFSGFPRRRGQGLSQFPPPDGNRGQGSPQ